MKVFEFKNILKFHFIFFIKFENLRQFDIKGGVDSYMDSQPGPMRKTRMGYQASPARTTGLRAGLRPQHVDRHGIARISNQANRVGSNRAGSGGPNGQL